MDNSFTECKRAIQRTC